jgi:hypothetical protein
MRTMSAALAAAACAALLPACGGTSSAPAPLAPDQWEANARDVIGVLVRDLELSKSTGDTIAEAGQALRDTWTLYTMLVAYTDFGGCDYMISAVGVPPPRFRPAERTMRAACAVLKHAAALFTRAAGESDAVLLRRANRLVLHAAPLLIRAAAELHAAQAVTRSHGPR